MEAVTRPPEADLSLSSANSSYHDLVERHHRGPSSGGSSGFDSDSAPSSVTSGSKMFRSPVDYISLGARPKTTGPSSGGMANVNIYRNNNDDLRRNNNNIMRHNNDDLQHDNASLERISPVVLERDGRSPFGGAGVNGSVTPTMFGEKNPDTDSLTNQSGYSDAGYHSLASSRSPTATFSSSRSPTATFSVSSTEQSSPMSGVGAKKVEVNSKLSSNNSVWNIRATTAGGGNITAPVTSRSTAAFSSVGKLGNINGLPPRHEPYRGVNDRNQTTADALSHQGGQDALCHAVSYRSSPTKRGGNDVGHAINRRSGREKLASHHATCRLEQLTDQLIVKILSYLSSIELVRLSRTCKRLYFLAWEPELWQSLSLFSPVLETDRALRALLEVLSRNSGLSAVRSVALNGSQRLTDRGLALIARRCSGLERLELQRCPGVTNGGLLDLLAKCQHLLHLDVSGCPMVNTVTLPHPASSNPLAGVPNSNPGRLSSYLPTSSSSSSSSGPGGGRVPPYLAGAGPASYLTLQHLDLSDCPSVDDTSVRLAVEHAPHLQYLFLRRCTAITDLSLKFISSYCLFLRELSVSDCPRITDTGLAELAKLGPSLRYLSVAKCQQITDTGVKHLVRHCYKLRYLNLRGCERISDLAMEAMASSCTRLRSLDIGKCDVTDLGLREVARHCPNLKKLSVRACEMVTDEGIKLVAYYCRGLQHLNIQDVIGITSEGYRSVKKHCRKCIIEHTNPGLA